MKKILATLIIFQSTLVFGQSDPDIGKLAKACELWGLVKYFHPSQPGNKFDSAFAAQVPNMLEAHSDAQWSKAVGDWLNVLNDRNTRVVEGGKEDESFDGEMKTEFIKDSILLVTISGPKIFLDWSIMGSFAEELIAKSKESKGVIFDLRQPGMLTQYEGYLTYIFDFTGLNKYFATGYAPKSRSIYYSGFKPERGNTSGGYSTSSVLRDNFSPGLYTVDDPKVVWIINEFSELPVVALSLQEAGAGFIVSTDDHIEKHLPVSNTFSFSDNITIKYKAEEVKTTTGGELMADMTYMRSDNPIDKARSLIVNGRKEKVKTTSAKNSMTAAATSFPSEKYPAVGYRILAAAKIYTVIQNFFPYHQFMDRNWRTILDESIPEFIKAKDEIEYGLAVAKMYANIQDSHGFISGNAGVDKLYGQAPSPVQAGFIENKVVVTGLRNDSICKAKGISIGDVILKVNGVPVEKLMKKFGLYYSHSTEQHINRLASQLCIRGDEGKEGTFMIEDSKGKTRDVQFIWTEKHNKYLKDAYKHKEIELISPAIGYADLTRLDADHTDAMFEQFKDTKAIIFDMRGYPKGTAWSIAPRLTEKKSVPLALFRKPEVLAPNIAVGDMLTRKSFTEFVQTVASSNKWKYKGKTVMIINEDAISQSEHTGLFFESVNNTVFIGSPTVGANGDVTNFQVPGGIWLSFSGQGVWHVDGRQLQRLGLQPHVPVKPTIKGIRAGKDEVFDKAVEWVSKNVK